MKGVIELNWKIVFIIIAGIIAFLIIFLFTTGLSKELIELVKNFKIEDLINIWKKLSQRGTNEGNS